MISPRLCALEIIQEAICNGSFPNVLYKETTTGFEDRDRKLITLLIHDTLSNLVHIDYILSEFIGGKKVKPVIKNILRMAIDQIRFLEFPAFAVINESVELCNEIKKPMLKGFVNGVLRNYVRNPEIKYPKEGTIEYYSIVNSKPLWLMKLWEKDYGFENAVKYSEIRNSGTAVRFKDGFDGEAWLNEKGYSFTKAGVVNNSYILQSSYGIHNTDEFKNGTLSIQGVGSILACEVLSPKSGETVLDACSAPGGKTVNICGRMGKGQVIACDISQSRLEQVKKNLKRCNIKIAKCMVQDMTIKNDSFVNKFDKVLVDAPCSGLGEVNSKPDILLNKSFNDIKSLASIQKRILDCCSEYVKSGGVLVYSTCTINKTENDDVVHSFLLKHKDFKLEKFTLGNNEIIESGMLQLTPDKWDGFFVARFVKQ